MLMKPRGQLYLAVLTHPPSPLSRLVFFSEEDAYTVHFSHNDALVVAIHIGCCKVSKILVDGGSSVNILYGHVLDRMEDTPELAQKIIIPQTQCSKCRPKFQNFRICSWLTRHQHPHFEFQNGVYVSEISAKI